MNTMERLDEHFENNFYLGMNVIDYYIKFYEILFNCDDGLKRKRK